MLRSAPSKHGFPRGELRRYVLAGGTPGHDQDRNP